MTERTHIAKDIAINSPVTVVWKCLTDPQHIKCWMGDPEMNIQVITTWQEEQSIIIKGFHHTLFENKGTVLRFKPLSFLHYNYLSSISGLEDMEENYTNVMFALEEKSDQTLLSLRLTNFPTDVIFKHLELYWPTTLNLLKHYCETNKTLAI